MNVIDAYNKNHGNIVIYVIGMYGSHKTKFAKDLANDLGFKHLNRDDYVENDMNVSESQYVDVDDNINWSQLKQDIESNKNVVVSGSSLPLTKLDVYVHYVIHIKISKQKMIDARLEFLEKHDMMKDDSRTKIKKIMDDVTYPYYLETLKTNKINKFINGNELSDAEIGDEMFTSVIHFIEKKIYKDSTTVIYDEKTNQYVLIDESNKSVAYMKQTLDVESDDEAEEYDDSSSSSDSNQNEEEDDSD